VLLGSELNPFVVPVLQDTDDCVCHRKHVFEDLRPYVCTFKDCTQGAHLYKGRHEWFAHEREMHRREWFCSKCKKSFASKEKFRDHLTKKHKNLISDSKNYKLDVMIDRGARAIEEKQKCSLCQEKYAPKQLRSHLGRHLEQIALFILPQSSEENEDSGSDPGSDDDCDDSEEESVADLNRVQGKNEYLESVNKIRHRPLRLLSLGSIPPSVD
jgi:hypothetical protein